MTSLEAAAGERYLTWQPTGLFNNWRVALENAALIAFGLNRTLVWPPIAPDVGAIASWDGFDSMVGFTGPRPALLEDFYDRAELSHSSLKSTTFAAFRSRMRLGDDYSAVASIQGATLHDPQTLLQRARRFRVGGRTVNWAP